MTVSARYRFGGTIMSEQSRLNLTKALVGLSIPLFVAIGVILLLVIGATAMMM